MSVEYIIICDGCAGVIDASRASAAVARASVKADGGRVNLPGGKDLCVTCLSQGVGPDGYLQSVWPKP